MDDGQDVAGRSAHGIQGVDDFGALQGDWQRIHFGPKGFLKASLEAVQQLASYSGRGEEERDA